MKKSVILILVLGLISIFSISVTAETVVEFWPWWLSTFEDYLNEMIVQFEAENPGIKINMHNVDGNLAQVLLTAISADEAPDIVNMNNSLAYQFYNQGVLEPLDLHIGTDVKDKYIDDLWNMTVFDGTFNYAFPWYASPYVLIYNKEIFEKAGLDPNNPPETWEEVMEYGKQIKNKTGAYAIVYDFRNLSSSFISECGVNIFTPDLKKANFNNKRVLKRLKYYQKGIAEGAIPKDLPNYQEARAMFESGELAMYPFGISMVRHIENNSPEISKKLGFGKYPVSTNHAYKCPNSMMNLTVLNSSDCIEEACKFGEFITSAYAQIEFAKLTTIVPSTKIGLNSDPYFAETTSNDIKVQKVASNAMSSSDFLTSNFNNPNGWDEIKSVITDEFILAVTGEKDCQTALNDAEGKVNEIIAELN